MEGNSIDIKSISQFYDLAKGLYQKEKHFDD